MSSLLVSFSNIFDYIHTFKGLPGDLCNCMEPYGSMYLRTPLPPSSPKPSSGGFFFRALLYRHRA